MKLHKINVLPQIPPELSPLWEIAYNLWWSWTPIAIDLFRRMDPSLWTACEHNPVALLGRIGSARLSKLAEDTVFLAHMNRVSEELERFRTETTWMGLNHPDWEAGPIAYFSMEYGFHESMPNYAGGLGILAGDHLKSASELGLPLFGVGLMYQQSHYHQHLTHDGWQKEAYQDNDFVRLAARLVKDPQNQPVLVSVEVGGKKAWLQAWELKAGHAVVYLLDANVERNEPAQRLLTNQLYAPGFDQRLGQEIVLGIGGVRMLHALGIRPSVFHMNEGHSAFLALERIRVLVRDHHLTTAEAVEAVRASTVFTTHTPVPAGIDRFEHSSIASQLSGELRDLGMSVDDLMHLGRLDGDARQPLSMAVLAIRTSAHRNGVSRLHGKVARQMWAGLWPGVPVREVPIGHVTNGVHRSTWLADEMARLFDRYVGPQWYSEPLNEEIWERVALIPDNELWRAKDRLRERLVGFVRRRLPGDLARRGCQAGEIGSSQEVLDPDVLTIGFARRFTSYKRATLFFRDPEQVAKLITDEERPLQIVFAGKAHPADQEGKRFIQEIVHQCRRKEFRNRLVFIEDYEFNIARYLVQGVDVWLNTPRRPMEACGTSGMKVVLNGGLHLSIRDGWWDEAYDPDAGWAIGGEEQFDDPAVQDQLDSQALYDLLREEVIPLYYERGEEGLPRRWLRKMKESMRRFIPVYNSNRMVKDYLDRYYLPAREGWEKFSAEDFRVSRDVAAWRVRVAAAWPSVAVTSFDAPVREEVGMNEMVDVRCTLALGGLSPQEVRVEVCHGTLDSQGEISDPRIEPLAFDKLAEGGDAVYAGAIRAEQSGTYAFTVRALPVHPHLGDPCDMGRVAWA
jgi:starch phosphorylase